MQKQKDILCPTCGKKDTWKLDNPHRPFCCERCKLIDLGAWADESHRIEGKDEDQLSSSDEDE